MNELRWILLLVGLVFLVVLTAWETHRARRAAPPREPFPHFDREPGLQPAPSLEARRGAPAAAPLTSGTTPREPPLGELPEGLVDSPHLDGADTEPISAQRGEPLRELPPVSAEPLGAAVAQPPTIEPLPEPELPAKPELPAEAELSAEAELPARAQTPPPRTPGAPQPPAAPLVAWPAEGERRIISVRVVGTGEQRLSGRMTRQALAACGFVHGRYRIFHQPTEDGRALLSCASLTKPGSFDPASMDYQRFSGLGLFTVLPGPLSAPAALDRLLDTARDLSHRLQARLLDDQGQPLDAARITALRASVEQLAVASCTAAADSDSAENAADVVDSAGAAVARGGPAA